MSETVKPEERRESESNSEQQRPAKSQQHIVSESFELRLHGKPFPVREDEGAFSNFFLDKISKSIAEKYPKARYELERKNGGGEVTAVVWHNINPDLRKEINDTLEWSLRKVEENRKTGV